MNCSNLRAINLPEGLTIIDESLFSGCSSLNAVILPTTVRRIYKSAFSMCTNLKTISIPAATVDIAYGAFSSCTSLESVFYGGTEDQRTAIEIADNNMPLIKATWIFNTPDIAVSNYLLIPSHVKIIEKWAFSNSGAEAIIINKACETIKAHAFSGCTKLKRIYIPSNVLHIDDNFIDAGSNTIVYCESESAAHKWCIANKHPFILNMDY